MPPPIFFGLVGAASTNIDVALYLLLTSAEYTSPVLANALSYGLAAISSFVLNKLITFRHRRLQTRAIMQVGAFALVRLLCFAISTVALTLGLLVVPNSLPSSYQS